ncbi:membrane cofactor protein-like isoform X2 [Saccopteryx bilineata]|uniref:membrane cofactor protein-like isoform X2 n=1 Tax=Saccopteryx bilineata TaxID=59482 RepID=UPI00338F80A4
MMTPSFRPRTTLPRCLESSFSCWSLAATVLVALVLLLPTFTDACDDPLRYNSMKLKGASQDVYRPGDQVEYECRPGYMRIVPPLPVIAVCQADNTWTPLQEACTKKSCPRPSEPLNGHLEGNLEFGSEVKYFCNEGFYLIGSEVLYCELSGDTLQWSGDPPICEKILCQPPKEIPDGTYTNNGKDTYEYNEVVTYSCNPSNGPDEFSLIGESTLICSGPDKWSSDPPECKVVKCPYPVVKNGRPTSGIGSKFYYKARVTFECLQGFLLEGSRTVVCGANSTWEPGLPNCTKELTPPPSTKPPILSTVSTPPSTKPPISSVPGVPPIQPTEPPVSSSPDSGTIIGIVVGVCCGVALICAGVFLYCHKKKKGTYLTGESHREVKFICL